VISVTDEEESLVDAFVAEFGVTHPLVILKTSELEDLIGVSGFPTSAVFANGELAWTGHPMEASGAVSKALKTATKGSVYPKELSKVRSLMKANRQGEAYAEILSNEGKYDAGAAAWAARVKAYLEERADAAFDAAKESAASGFLWRATQEIGGYAAPASPMPRAPEMREWLAKLEAETPEWKKELAGGEALHKAAELEKTLDFLGAFNGYKAVMKKCQGLRIGANAEQAARAIVDGRKAGYNPNCEHCDSKTKMACLKHAEKIKL
jgi:hypothetical protein